MLPLLGRVNTCYGIFRVIQVANWSKTCLMVHLFSCHNRNEKYEWRRRATWIRGFDSFIVFQNLARSQPIFNFWFTFNLYFTSNRNLVILDNEAYSGWYGQSSWKTTTLLCMLFVKFMFSHIEEKETKQTLGVGFSM